MSVNVIGQRMDFYAMIHACWLIAVLYRRRRKAIAEIWPKYCCFLACIITFQYFICIGIPPAPCRGECPPAGSLLRDSGDKGTEGRPDPAPPASTLQITPGGSRAPASTTTSSSGCTSQTSSCGPTPCSSCVSGAVGIPTCSSFSWWCVRAPPYPLYSHRLSPCVSIPGC